LRTVTVGKRVNVTPSAHGHPILSTSRNGARSFASAISADLQPRIELQLGAESTIVFLVDENLIQVLCWSTQAKWPTLREADAEIEIEG